MLWQLSGKVQCAHTINIGVSDQGACHYVIGLAVEDILFNIIHIPQPFAIQFATLNTLFIKLRTLLWKIARY